MVVCNRFPFNSNHLQYRHCMLVVLCMKCKLKCHEFCLNDMTIHDSKRRWKNEKMKLKNREFGVQTKIENRELKNHWTNDVQIQWFTMGIKTCASNVYAAWWVPRPRTIIIIIIISTHVCKYIWFEIGVIR